MVQTLKSLQDIVDEAKKKCPDAPPRSFKFKHLVAAVAERESLDKKQIDELAAYLGIKFFPKPKTIPENWQLKLSKSFLAQMYTNPNNPEEYIVIKHPDAPGKLPYIIHKTPSGYADARWFYEVIPALEEILKKLEIDGAKVFSKRFNRDFRQSIEKIHQTEMTPGQIQALNLFFGKYVPSLEGLCGTCFSVSLPYKGAGERWLFKTDERFEVRLSAAKPTSLNEVQTTEYVTHSEASLDQTKIVHAAWNKNTCTITFDENMEQANTHIPYEVYDFSKFNLHFPVCTCKAKFS